MRGKSYNKHTSSCSASLVIREMHIKIRMRYHLTSARMALTEKVDSNKC